MGNGFIFPYCLNTFSVTKASVLTSWARPSSIAMESNLYKPLENRHGEKEAKAGMGRKVWSRPRISEKRQGKDFRQPYREPGEVSWLRRPRRIGINALRELGKLALYLR